ncbi:MAG: hypothetical protein J0H19_25410 [Rhodospirillales bacterium]|nr:hypothetical protein [Rhodospirillales bacterium]MBN8929944.1 hypothetical protein [Rhodospirillales bacterium]
MSVDLKEAQKCDKVKFRIGGAGVIHSKKSGRGLVEFTFVGCEEFSMIYYYDGRYSSGGNHPWDIIALEPAPFDWNTVRPGMAFNHCLGNGIHYIGPSFVGLEYCYGREFGHELKSGHFDKAFLTRAPEHDIEVQPCQ